MIKVEFSKYTPRTHGNRSIEEAISELQREMDTRKRIFDNWVATGRCSWVDAHDRMERHLTALKLLIQYSNELSHAEAEENNPASQSLSFVPANGLDTAPAEQAA